MFILCYFEAAVVLLRSLLCNAGFFTQTPSLRLFTYATEADKRSEI